MEGPQSFYMFYSLSLSSCWDVATLLFGRSGSFELVFFSSIGNCQDSHRVCKALTTSPSLKCNDSVTLFNNSQLECFGKTILDTIINIFLPLTITLWTRVGVEEGITTTIQVNVSCCVFITSDCKEEEKAKVKKLLDPFSLLSYSPSALLYSLVKMGHRGRYLLTNRAVLPLVLMRRMAPACCSRLALTAAMATVSLVSVGT